MTRWTALLLVACGGMADAADEPEQVIQRERSWCCDDEADGEPILTCGIEVRPATGTCYCNGIVNTRWNRCTSILTYTPGTRCTGSDRICW